MVSPILVYFLSLSHKLSDVLSSILSQSSTHFCCSCHIKGSLSTLKSLYPSITALWSCKASHHVCNSAQISNSLCLLSRLPVLVYKHFRETPWHADFPVKVLRSFPAMVLCMHLLVYMEVFGVILLKLCFVPSNTYHSRLFACQPSS